QTPLCPPRTPTAPLLLLLPPRPPSPTLFPTRRSSDLEAEALAALDEATDWESAIPGMPGAAVVDIMHETVLGRAALAEGDTGARSEEHTSELQSRENLVCRLLLEKKNEKRELIICIRD